MKKNLSQLKEGGPAHAEHVASLISQAQSRAVSVDPVNQSDLDDFTERYQIPSSSFFGSFLSQYGALYINKCQLRIRGCSGSDNGLSINDINRSIAILDGLLIFADDIYGNIYATNLGRVPDAEIGDTCVLFADEVRWQAINTHFPDFLSWSLTGDLSQIFDDFRIADDLWENTPRAQDKCVSFFPPLFTEEGSIDTSTRSLVPYKEALSLRLQLVL